MRQLINRPDKIVEDTPHEKDYSRLLIFNILPCRRICSAPRLQAQVRVFCDGKIVLDGRPTDFNLTRQSNMKKLNFTGILSLGSELPPGDYVLQIIVTDTLANRKYRMVSQWMQFEIVE